ncbi:uncharacterized protein [Pyxicephalus adspersus]|uniref:Uncharacterized protein n=1 Tax=Pyxicephalus adspersus TaxID=30357 RepID=A0AAV2ZTS8_PYXAD|nr:TPA: hypothetical protein GDO54_004635 [Pyxicephalus adspersus]
MLNVGTTGADMMKGIVIISIALLYFKESVYAASTTGLKETSYPDPENVGGEEYTLPAHENLTQQSSKHFSDQMESVNRTHPTMSFEQIVNLTNCTVPLVPKNGGLVCVYIDNIYYCKPMCNKGYDFAFLRRSRLYEECGSKTNFKWTTQYVGGSRLAECIESDVLVSGQPSTYFNKEKCEEIVSDKERKQKYIDEFISELKTKGIQKNHKEEMNSVACGKC